MSPTWRLSVAVALQTLRANPLHTILSTLGIIIGVGALVAILALGDGMERFAREQIETTTDLQMISVSSRTTEMVGGVLVRLTDATVLSPADAASLRGVIGAGGGVTISTSAGVEFRLPGDTARAGALVLGTLSDAPAVGDLRMLHGRYLTEEEVAASAAVVVLDSVLAARVAKDVGQAVGAEVGLGDATMTVIGVVARAATGPARAYVPITSVAATSPLALQRPPTLTVIADRVEEVPALRAVTEGWMAERFGERASGLEVTTNVRRVDQVQRGMLMFKLVMGAITGISIVVGGIGVMNVLLVSIVERTREIGIRKATGARRRDIAIQFLTESVTISSFGSVLGVVFGLAAVFAFAPIVRALIEAPFRPAITWVSVATALAVAVLMGVLFGTYPAMRAARLEPADAIRHET